MRQVYRLSVDVSVDGGRATCDLRIATAHLDDVYGHLDRFVDKLGWSVLRHNGVTVERKAMRREPEGWVEVVSRADVVVKR